MKIFLITVYEQVVSVELNGSDIDNDSLTYNINSNPSNGTIAFTGNSTIAYNPNSGFTGNDSFTYSASDGTLDSNIATVSITVESIEVGYISKWRRTAINCNTYNLTRNNSYSNTGVELRKDGQKILDINSNVGNSSIATWTVPSDLTSGGGYVIRVYNADSVSEFDESDNTFTIANSSHSLTFPAGGEELICGRTYPIRWENGYNNNGIELFNGTEKISELNGDVGSVNKFSWTVDCGSVGDGFRIRIYDAGPGTDFFEGSTFTIDTDPKNKYSFIESIQYAYTIITCNYRTHISGWYILLFRSIWHCILFRSKPNGWYLES